MSDIVPITIIERKVYLFRGERVMLDEDLAGLYEVATKVFNQAVKRQLRRFPPDFMFQLTREESAELEALGSQNVTLKKGRGQHRKYLPFVFTEQGIVMLSTVLGSDRAIEVNIQIMRTFVKLREMIASNRELARRLDDLEKKYDVQFRVVFDAIRSLMAQPEPNKRKIGFKGGEKG
jgi:hypothetical protein